MIHRKGAIELSSNIFIVTIIAVVVLALSATFLYQFVGSSEKATKEIDKGAHAALSQPEYAKVSIAPGSAQLRPGEEQIVEIRVLNVGNPASFFTKAEIQTEEHNIIPSVSWLTYSQKPFTIENGAKHQEKMLISIPVDAHKGTYRIRVKVFRKGSPDIQYGQTLAFELDVTEEGKQQKKIDKQPKPIETERCLKDFACDYYVVFVPLDKWKSQELFDAKVAERALFFIDISPLKSKKTGTVAVPLKFAESCALKGMGMENAEDHMRIKSCADKYADKLGIAYERAIGLSSEYEGGKAFFKSKAVYASLGHEGANRPGIVAHEIGHTYSLCDEYDYPTYISQNVYFQFNTCKNKWPTQCSESGGECQGNTPTFRDYSRSQANGVCSGEKHYSVMGLSLGAECGYDATGGYQALEEGMS